jgi:predicted O-methyltransferase YrrM
MSEPLWSAVDAYVEDLLLGPDPALDAAVHASAEAGLPPIAVTAPQGKLLHLLARVQGARSILELGTLGGYSSIWLARALPPDGRLLTLELDPSYAQVAAANIERAGLAERIQMRVGPALDTLEELLAEGAGPFDLIFIDADKQSTPQYFARALELSRRGSVIVVDNVVRGGAVIDSASEDPRAQGMRHFHELLGAECAAGRVSATTIQTVGGKGYDGFTLVLVDAER